MINEKEIITKSQKSITDDIDNNLKQIDNPTLQIQKYLHWITRIKYLVELHICWKIQGFQGYPFDDILPISLQLAKQEWKLVHDWIQEYRESPEYEKELKELEDG